MWGQAIGSLARLTPEEADDLNLMSEEVVAQLKSEGAYTKGSFELLSEATTWLRSLLADLVTRT